MGGRSDRNTQYGNYTVKLYNNNTIIHVDGGMGLGVSKSITNLLESNPNVSGIVLDSIGGRIIEGRRISKIITDYGLNTYSFKGCYSICTIAFIAGKNRYLGRGANLAFHQYKIDKGLSEYVDLAKEQKNDIQLFQRQGVTDDFMEKLYNASAGDFWYPTLDEMIAAKVVHGTINQSEVLPQSYQSYKITMSDINKAFIEIPVYETIKKHSPKTYEKIVTELEKQIKSGASFLDIQRSVISVMMEIAGKTMSISSDEALIEYAVVITDVLRKLEEIDPILCLKYVFPKKYGAITLGSYLADADTSPMLDILNNIIIDAYEKNNQPVDTNTAEALMADITLRLGEEAQYIQLKGLENSADYKRACDGIIKFYKLIIAEDKAAAGNALRYVFR